MAIKKYLSIFIITGILFVDQLAKWAIVRNFFLGEEYKVIGDFLVFQYIENYGIAFGIGTNLFPDPYQKIFFISFMIIAIIVVIYFYTQLPKNAYSERISFAFILGGGFGNLFDKIFGHIIFHQKFQLFYGRVVDFIQFRYDDYIGPTFNIADIFISIGIIILFFSSSLHKEENK